MAGSDTNPFPHTHGTRSFVLQGEKNSPKRRLATSI